ncbi:hypothetical protein PanWU01x14_300530 [Parasponia andersonii]|uniref:Uncharacterized protein n=1 Tax=Parasponia andersonii TaxID=3476 RepID=A0A2P5AU07_PARAD|nr:hypothetical protein PanWU01x14_300530 [Parasponia andersonii]
MAGQLCQVHWTEDALIIFGIHITSKFIDETLSCYWEFFAKGLTDYIKAYVPFDKDAPGWTHEALVGFFGKYSGTKDIHFAPANAKIRKLLQLVDIFLRDKVCGELLILLEGVAISNEAGKVAEAVVLALNYGAATKIKLIAVLSRGKLVFDTDEIAPNAVTLLCGIDDMPAIYIEHVLAARGFIITDDMVVVESRNVDALALYYSRHGMKLTIHGRKYGIRNYTEVLADAGFIEKLKTWEGPANFSLIGLASIGVAVATRVYETLVPKLSGSY